MDAPDRCSSPHESSCTAGGGHTWLNDHIIVQLRCCRVRPTHFVSRHDRARPRGRSFFSRDAVSGEEAVQRRYHHCHANLAHVATQLIRVRSRRASCSTSTGFLCAAIRRDRLFLPGNLAAEAPVLLRLSRHRITVAAATPNRTAAVRQLIPSSIAASARDRKPIDTGLPIRANFHPASTVDRISAFVWIPLRLTSIEKGSKWLASVSAAWAWTGRPL